MTLRTIDVLSTEECYELLHTQLVGRLAYVDDVGPAALPVNYAVIEHDIVFRVEADSVLRQVIDHPVGFEVDKTDPEQSFGWSVLARGQARHVPLDEVPGLLGVAHEEIPRPWAAGIHNIWIRIGVKEISGRRLSKPFSGLVF